MKINAEIEVDWIEDGNIDDVVEDRLFRALSAKIEQSFVDKAGKRIAEAAHRLITAKTELLINTVLEQPVDISDAWNHKEKYDSVYDMVEKKMTALYEGKLNISGQCEKDPLMANIEGYVKSTTEKLLKDVQRTIEVNVNKQVKREVSESELFKTLERVVKIKGT